MGLKKNCTLGISKRVVCFCNITVENKQTNKPSKTEDQIQHFLGKLDGQVQYFLCTNYSCLFLEGR